MQKNSSAQLEKKCQNKIIISYLREFSKHSYYQPTKLMQNFQEECTLIYQYKNFEPKKNALKTTHSEAQQASRLPHINPSCECKFGNPRAGSSAGQCQIDRFCLVRNTVMHGPRSKWVGTVNKTQQQRGKSHNNKTLRSTLNICCK